MTADQKRVVETTMTNDENSTDAEMVHYFVTEIGITEDEAAAAIAKRGEVFEDAPEEDDEPADGGEIDFNAETGREVQLRTYKEKYG